MDSASRSSSKTNLPYAQPEQPRLPQSVQELPPPPAGSRGIPPIFRPQEFRHQTDVERIASDWMLQRMSSGELSIDSPGKRPDTRPDTRLETWLETRPDAPRTPEKYAEALEPDASDLPPRERIEKYFRSAGTVRTMEARTQSRSQSQPQSLPNSAELLSSESAEDALLLSSGVSDQRIRQQVRRIVSATEALADAHVQMDALAREEKELALIYAASRGYLSVVKKLIREGVDITAEDANGCTALQAANDYGHPAVADYLGRHMPGARARPSGAGRRDRQQTTEQEKTLGSLGGTVAALREALAYNIRVSARVANRPESQWYAQSPSQALGSSRDTD